MDYNGSRVPDITARTNCLTGETTYFEKGKCSDIVTAIRASATMPYISPMVMIDGVPHFDGGCSCKIPYQWAINQGFDKIIVIRTRESSFRKKVKPSPACRIYRKYPAFAQKFENITEDYNRQCDEIEALNNEGRLLRFAPTVPVTVSRIEGDMEKLGALYRLGWDDCLAGLDQIRDYL